MRTINSAKAIVCAAVISLACACTSEPLTESAKTGGSISFGITMRGGSAATKTSYSDDIKDGVERIDWVDGDLITIACAEAKTDKSADYRITGHTTEGQLSRGTISPASSESQLKWGEDDEHSFYAVYPSPETEGVQSGVSFDAGTHVLTAVLPSVQTSADMKLAYMGAGTSQKKSDGEASVSLDFNPLVTTFQVTVVNGYTSGEMKLYSAGITSSSTALTGEYTVTLSNDGSYDAVCPEHTEANGTITVDFGGEANPTVLAKDAKVEFTIFALPQDITDLSVFVETSDGIRKLALNKSDSTPVKFTACKKYDINNLSVPEPAGFVFEVEAPSVTAFDTRSYSSQTFTVTSTKGTNPAAWTAKFSTDGGETWTDTAPASFFSTFPVSGDGGKDMLQSFNVPLQEHYYEGYGDDTHENYYDKKLYDAPTVSDVDLSYRDVMGNSTSRNTANCYVVRAGGSYKIPCVYGNAIKDGATNSGAYQTSGMLGNFLDYQDSKITQPWIQHTVKVLIEWGHTPVSTTADYASLLWEDVDGLVTGVELIQGDDGCYIKFNVPQSSIRQGNAVVALRSLLTGYVLWSWHIWVTSQDLDAVSVSSSKPGVMPINLGWVSTNDLVFPEQEVKVLFTQTESGNTQEFTLTRPEYRVPQGYSPYYQWGRKDPMQPNVGWDDPYSDRTVYGGSFSINTSYSKYNTGKISIGNTIKNPMIFYPYYAFYGGNGITNANLWDANLTATMDQSTVISNKTNVTKTVYDPCPAGFTAPVGNLFCAFVTDPSDGFLNEPVFHKIDGYDDSGTNNLIHGYLFNTTVNDKYIFFPTCQSRDSSTGAIYSSNSRIAFYWTSCAYSQYYGYSCTFTCEKTSSGRFFRQINSSMPKSSALSMRPTVEQ